jgi:hypothetical protein
MIPVTGVAPDTGAFTPGMADIVTSLAVGGAKGLGHPSTTMAINAAIIGNSNFILIIILLVCYSLDF